MTYTVDPDITVASTLDSAFYGDESAFALARERVFARHGSGSAIFATSRRANRLRRTTSCPVS